MATSLSGAITLQTSLTYTNALDMRDVVDSLARTISLTLTNGTGANQATQVWADTRTTDNTGESLDFNGGGLTNAFGAAVAMTRMVALIVTASSSNTVDTQVNRVATAGMDLFIQDGDGAVLKPGMTLAFLVGTATAVTMTAGDTDSLQIKAATAGNVTYDIIIVGS